MGCSESELSILLTGNREIARLNFRYRGKKGPTDVLSFALLEGQGRKVAPEILGDVVISLEKAIEQAAEEGREVAEEITRLLIHGVLHLLGYDHEHVSKAEALRMKRKENALWRALKKG